MAKQYKIKRRYHKKDGVTFKAKPHPLFILLLVGLAVGLIFVGVSIYDPVSEFILNIGKTPPPSPSQPEEVSAAPKPEPQPEPEPEPKWEAPNTLRALELPLETAKNPSALSAWLSALPESVNAVMVRVKNADGIIQYDSSNASLAQWATLLQAPTMAESPLDLGALSETLRQRDLALVVWMSAFRDPIAARGDRENSAVLHQSGALWLDNAPTAGGQPWLNPYSASARGYLNALVSEVTALGADLVVFDNVLFPNDPTGGANWGETGGLDRSQILARFLSEAGAVAEANGARVMPYFAQQLAGDTLSALAESVQYGGEPAAITAGPLLVRLSLPESAAFGGEGSQADAEGQYAALSAGEILEGIPEAVRSRLAFVLESGVPAAAELEALELQGVREFICLAQ